jgi:phage shock protein PspC (stress-responsive transcriptional regulator)
MGENLPYFNMIQLEFSIWEVLMLFCFACSWPVSIIKSLKTKFVLGKSPSFMVIIIIGYVFGIIHKFTVNPDIVTILWIFNMLLVGFDLVLYFRYAKNNRKQLKESQERENQSKEM